MGPVTVNVLALKSLILLYAVACERVNWISMPSLCPEAVSLYG